MNTKELIKKYSAGKGTDIMWKSVDIISDILDEKLSPAEMEQFEKKMYSMMQGKHYDEYFAKKEVEGMYYTDEHGERHESPYWTDGEIKAVWQSVQPKIMGDYTMWDFYVAMNMTKSDNCNMLRRWFPEATIDEMTKMLVDMAVNWLNDEDDPSGGVKVWYYFNK